MYVSLARSKFTVYAFGRTTFIELTITLEIGTWSKSNRVDSLSSHIFHLLVPHCPRGYEAEASLNRNQCVGR